jgi:hypothetical protein
MTSTTISPTVVVVRTKNRTKISSVHMTHVPHTTMAKVLVL